MLAILTNALERERILDNSILIFVRRFAQFDVYYALSDRL